MASLIERMERALEDDFDGSRELLRVYADALEEQGDARAQLIRVQLDAEAERAPDHVEFELDGHGQDEMVSVPHVEHASRPLFAEHWSRWFGELPRRALALEWKGGFPRTARLRDSLPGWSSCRPFLSLPTFRFLRSFTMGQFRFEGTAEGLESLSCLEELTWHLGRPKVLEPLKGKVFPRLLSLGLRTMVEPSYGDFTALHTLSVPSLTQLSLELHHDPDTTTLSALGFTPWFPRLSAVKIFLRSSAAIDVLPSLELGAKAVKIELPVGLAVTERARLRALLPHAVISPVPHSDPPDHTHSVPMVSDAPGFAPADFASLPPWQEQKVPRGQNSDAIEHRLFVGSGVRFEDVGHAQRFSRCCQCGSDDTRCISFAHDQQERSFDTIDWFRIEYRCCECGKFTRYVETREH